jgi:hypothetical protein
MSSFFERMQNFDRRWIYLVLAVVLVISLIKGKPETPIVLDSVQHLYDAVDAAPAGPGQEKLILLETTFAANTLGENGLQTRAIVRHMMLTHKRFAVISIDQQGAKLGPAIVNELAPYYGYEYGKDWISFGLQLGVTPFYKSFLKDVIGTVKTDSIKHQPLPSYPIMRGIKTIKEIPLLLEMTASASIYPWFQYVQPATTPRLKIGYGPTGVMVAEAYPFLDSGQLIGMAPGLKGAADYEKLVDALEAKAVESKEIKKPYDPKTSSLSGMGQSARQLMFTQNYAHLVIILFIFLGNIGMLLARRKPRRAPKEEANG